MARSIIGAAGVTLVLRLGVAGVARAETVMQQCGQQYQAAKAGGTLNGMSWNQFRTDCAARLKAQPASATAPAPVAPAPAPAAAPAPVVPAPAPAPATAANPLKPAPAAPAPSAAAPGAKPVSAGRAAETTRQRQCGAEWRANKATLVAQTPGLTWPKYWSQCNKRLKAAGQ